MAKITNTATAISQNKSDKVLNGLSISAVLYKKKGNALVTLPYFFIALMILSIFASV